MMNDDHVIKYRPTEYGWEAIALNQWGEVRGWALRDGRTAAGRSAARVARLNTGEDIYIGMYASDPWRFQTARQLHVAAEEAR